MSELIPQWVILRVFGVVYCFLWFFSIVAGFFILICPSIFLAFYCPKAYRKWTDLVFGMWESYPVVLMELLFGVKVVMSGDWIDPSEGSIIMMNHRTRLDWNFLWAAFYHGAHPHNHSLKYILKSEIMYIPGPGWVMQACSFLFIKRQWSKDKQLMSKVLEYLQITDEPCQILIFPEGTDLTAKSVEKSNAFADKSKLQHYSKVLHPRTTGFIHLVTEMRRNGQLQAVYDFTVGYPKTLAEKEIDLLKGEFPSEIHFHVTRYDDAELPREEEGLKQWLAKLWQEKEAVLHEFYEHGSFNPQDCIPDCSEENSLSGLLRARRRRREETATCQCQNYYAYDMYNLPPTANGLQNGNQRSYQHMRSQSQSQTTDDDRENQPRSTHRCLKMKQYSTGHLLYLSLIFWTLLVALFIYLTLFAKNFQMWAAFNAFVFLLLTMAGDGFQQILARYNVHDCLLKTKSE